MVLNNDSLARNELPEFNLGIPGVLNFSALSEEINNAIIQILPQDDLPHEINDVVVATSIPYSNIPETQNTNSLIEILSFLQLDNGSNIGDIVDQIHVGNFHKLKKSLNQLFSSFKDNCLKSPDEALITLKKLPHIINILNSILILSLKSNFGLEKKILFINYINNCLENDNFENAIDLLFKQLLTTDTKTKKEILNKLLLESQKFKRNFAPYIYDSAEVGNEEKISKLSPETVIIETIKESTLGIIKHYKNLEEIKQQNIINNILLAIITIEKCANIINNGGELNENKTHEVIHALDIVDIFEKDIDTGRIKGLHNVLKIKHKLLELKNEKLEQSSTIDGLTQIKNRRKHDKDLESIISQIRRFIIKNGTNKPENQRRFYFLLDIDHFKKINDEHGHLIGDKILHHFAQRIENEIRDGDSVYRYGGEEFAIISTEMSYSDALKFAEKIRRLIEENPYEDKEGNKYYITVSIGFCDINSSLCTEIQIEGNKIDNHAKHKKGEFMPVIWGDNASIIIVRADQALYLAKGTGRNKFIFNNGDECDLLTGLSNKNEHNTHVESLIDEINDFKAKNGINKPEDKRNFYSVIDVDRLKLINDEYGRPIGDQILIHLTEILKDNIKDFGSIFRTGGEQFVVVTSEISMIKACEILENIRNNIKNKPYTNKGFEYPITVSIGICEINNSINGTDNTTNRKKIEKNAGNALHKASSNGDSGIIFDSYGKGGTDFINIEQLVLLLSA